MNDDTPLVSESLVNGTQVAPGDLSSDEVGGRRVAFPASDPTPEEELTAYVCCSPDGLVYTDLIRFLMSRGHTHQRAQRAVMNCESNGWIRSADHGVYRKGARFDPLENQDFGFPRWILVPVWFVAVFVAALALVLWLVIR